MKRLLILLFVVTVSTSSCTISQSEETTKESKPALVVPETLKDHWTDWIVGEWEFFFESGEGESMYKSVMKAELGLNGQFLILKYESEITDEHTEELKKSMETSNQEAEKFKRLTHKEMELSTIDPKTGGVIGYLFDSLRCIAEGTGKRQGNKEIIEWKWSATAQGATSVYITEKISDNKFTINQKYTLPDGGTMEDKGVMTRRKKETLTQGKSK